MTLTKDELIEIRNQVLEWTDFATEPAIRFDLTECLFSIALSKILLQHKFEMALDKTDKIILYSFSPRYKMLVKVNVKLYLDYLEPAEQQAILSNLHMFSTEANPRWVK